MPSYCEIAPGHPFHGPYHAKEYGFPIQDDTALFERLALEINQAGLSWLTILKKREGFAKAFHGFNIERIARYQSRDRARLLANAAIIRNQLKIKAVIENAKRLQEIQRDYGSFRSWLDLNHPKKLEDWITLFKRTFCFTGQEITREFLVSTGYLEGAHTLTCPVYEEVLKKQPAWKRTKERQGTNEQNLTSVDDT